MIIRMCLGAGTDWGGSLSILGGAPRHAHIKTGRFYRSNIRPRGWREEEEGSSSPNIHQTEVEGAGVAGLVSVMEKVLVNRENNKVLQGPELSPSPQELWDKQN